KRPMSKDPTNNDFCIARIVRRPGYNRMTDFAVQPVGFVRFGLLRRLSGLRMGSEESDMWIKDVSDDVRTRIQMMYMEMPDIRLTRPQIRRLLSLPFDACEDAIRGL